MGIAGLLAAYLLRLGFILFRIFLTLGMVVGIWRALTPLPAYISSPKRGFDYVLDSAFLSCGYIIDYIGDNWQPLGIAIILWAGLATKRIVDEISERTSSSLVAAVALLGYFQLGTDSDATKQMRELGLWKAIKKNFTDRLFFSLLGMQMPANEYSARPVRNDAPITFDADLNARHSR